MVATFLPCCCPNSLSITLTFAHILVTKICSKLAAILPAIFFYCCPSLLPCILPTFLHIILSMFSPKSVPIPVVNLRQLLPQNCAYVCWNLPANCFQTCPPFSAHHLLHQLPHFLLEMCAFLLLILPQSLVSILP